MGKGDAFNGLCYFLNKSRTQASRVLSHIDPDKESDDYEIVQSWLREIDSLINRIDSSEAAKVVD